MYSSRFRKLLPFLILASMGESTYDSKIEYDEKSPVKRKCQNPLCDKDAERGRTHCSVECYKKDLVRLKSLK